MKVLLSFLIFFNAYCSNQVPLKKGQHPIKGKVVRVKDGDTVVVLDEKSKEHTIRVSSIDCPERGQPFSKKAKEFVIDEIAGKEILVWVRNKDRYKREVGEIHYDPTGKSCDTEYKSLAKELLKKGLAWHYKYYSKNEELSRLEQEAKENKVGLWSEKNPTPPWEYRKQKREGNKTKNK